MTLEKPFHPVMHSVAPNRQRDAEDGAPILCVDDNTFVLSALSDCLERAGHRVLIARSALEALGMFRREHDAIRVVVTDVDMPIMSGVELASTIKSESQDCSVLLISGNPLPPEAEGLECGFLAKPFPPGVFLETVEGMLAASVNH
jgi:CheY-like chemotaxis protein